MTVLLSALRKKAALRGRRSAEKSAPKELIFQFVLLLQNTTKTTTKCPGCEVLKSVHNFGPAGKHCPGSDLVEDDQGSKAALAEPTVTSTAKAPDMDSNAALLQWWTLFEN